MTAEEYINFKELVKNLNSEELITIVAENLAKIKNVLTLINIIVIELQVRKLDL